MKKKKIKKKYPDFPHVGHLIPTNLLEQKSRFFESNEKYDPLFSYDFPLKKKFKRKPDCKYISTAKKILNEALRYYGSHKKLIVSGGELITKK